MAYVLFTRTDSQEPRHIEWAGKPLHLPIQQLQYIVRILRENFPEYEYTVKQEGEK